jgi:hypothetical protein
LVAMLLMTLQMTDAELDAFRDVVLGARLWI